MPTIQGKNGADLVATARAYSSAGLRVAPACDGTVPHAGRKEGESCQGKAIHVLDWSRQPPTLHKTVKLLERNDPRWNALAHPVGAIELVLDIDARSGGLDSLKILEAEIGALPPTPAQRTGGGGLHYFFGLPADVTFKAGGSLHWLGYPGIEWKAWGGQVLLAPSLHPSGNSYAWLPGQAWGEVPEAQIPAALLELIGKASAPPNRGHARMRRDNGYQNSRLSWPEIVELFAMIYPEGTRRASQGLPRLVGILLSRGVEEDTAVSFLTGWEQDHFAPPLGTEEIQHHVRAMYRRYRGSARAGGDAFLARLVAALSPSRSAGHTEVDAHPVSDQDDDPALDEKFARGPDHIGGTGDTQAEMSPVPPYRRTTICYRCKRPLDSTQDPVCIRCGWLKCACGACRPGCEEDAGSVSGIVTADHLGRAARVIPLPERCPRGRARMTGSDNFAETVISYTPDFKHKTWEFPYPRALEQRAVLAALLAASEAAAAAELVFGILSEALDAESASGKASTKGRAHLKTKEKAVQRAGGHGVILRCQDGFAHVLVAALTLPKGFEALPADEVGGWLEKFVPQTIPPRLIESVAPGNVPSGCRGFVGRDAVNGLGNWKVSRLLAADGSRGSRSQAAEDGLSSYERNPDATTPESSGRSSSIGNTSGSAEGASSSADGAGRDRHDVYVLSGCSEIELEETLTSRIEMIAGWVIKKQPNDLDPFLRVAPGGRVFLAARRWVFVDLYAKTPKQASARRRELAMKLGFLDVASARFNSKTRWSRSQKRAA